MNVIQGQKTFMAANLVITNIYRHEFVVERCHVLITLLGIDQSCDLFLGI